MAISNWQWIPMKFIVILGPPAVGKMSVGYELAKLTFNSNGDFFYTDNYLKIDNTQLSPDEAARRIVEAFNLKV